MGLIIETKGIYSHLIIIGTVAKTTHNYCLNFSPLIGLEISPKMTSGERPYFTPN
jgi:hypothetical protein